MKSEKKLMPKQEIKEQQDLQSIKNLYRLKNDENKSASELFDLISSRIRALSGEKMLEAESKEAARRFISFAN